MHFSIIKIQKNFKVTVFCASCSRIRFISHFGIRTLRCRSVSVTRMCLSAHHCTVRNWFDKLILERFWLIHSVTWLCNSEKELERISLDTHDILTFALKGKHNQVLEKKLNQRLIILSGELIWRKYVCWWDLPLLSSQEEQTSLLSFQLRYTHAAHPLSVTEPWAHPAALHLCDPLHSHPRLQCQSVPWYI